MEWLLKRQIAMHWPGLKMSATPGLLCQAIEIVRGGAIQSWRGAIDDLTADRLKKCFLIHGLIGTAPLQPNGSIGSEQQQGLTGTIGFDSSGQKVGNSGTRCGDHR